MLNFKIDKIRRSIIDHGLWYEAFKNPKSVEIFLWNDFAEVENCEEISKIWTNFDGEKISLILKSVV